MREDHAVKIPVDVTQNEITVMKGPDFVSLEPLFFGLDENGSPALWVQKTKNAPRLTDPVVRLVLKPTTDGLIDRGRDRHYFGSVVVASGAVHLFIEQRRAQ